EDDSTHLSGTILAKKTSGNTRVLEIETDTGRKRSLNLHKDVVINYDGDQLAYRDLAVGDVADFVIVDGEVAYIQVTERQKDTRYISGIVTKTRIARDEMDIEVRDSN